MIRLRRFLLTFAAVLVLLPAAVFASEQFLDVVKLAQRPVFLTEHFAVLQDKDAKLQIGDVVASAPGLRFTTGQPPAWSLNFGFTHSAYWLRLQLKNPGAERFDGMLEFMYPRLAANVQVFTSNASGAFSTFTTGYRFPFSDRPYPHHYYVFPVSMEPQSESTIFFRFQSDMNLEIPARLWQRDAFHQYERVDYVSNALYFGMSLGLMAFNFLLYFALRSKRYLLYVGFGVSSALSIAADNGLAMEYLWGNSFYWSNISAAVGYSVSLALGILFMRSMIDTRKLVPRLDTALQVALALHFALPVGIAISYVTFIKPLLAIAGLTSLLLLLTGALCAIKRDRSAMYFSAAFSVMAIGATANSLRGLGIIPTTFFSTHGIQIGSAIEMLVLAFALADRYSVIQKEKEQAQKMTLSAQQLLVENLQSTEKALESRVAERTNELELLNAKLEALSVTDGLTGIANRRHFDEVLEREWRRALRAGQPLAVGMLDVDWFKKYNDRYGHLSGDECLKHVADVLSISICRTGDLAARYGGEEFAFIALGVDSESALAMAQNLCAALSASQWKHEESEWGYVTASIGVATMIPTQDTSPSDLLMAADGALYQAKGRGRNQVVLGATIRPVG